MLQSALGKIGRFTTEEVSLVEKFLIRRQFKRNEILLNEGAICQSVYLILTGAAYQFSVNDVEENIIDFYIEDDWVMNYPSFVGQKPSTTYIKAFTDCETLELTIHILHHLIEISPAFFQLGKVMEQGMARIHYFDHAFSPLQKYNHLVETKPRLLQHFPLKMIASYLKITPETLSRVRGIY